jgi:hypothetical protein
MASLDQYGKFHPDQILNPTPSSQQQIAILTMPSWLLSDSALQILYEVA